MKQLLVVAFIFLTLGANECRAQTDPLRGPAHYFSLIRPEYFPRHLQDPYRLFTKGAFTKAVLKLTAMRTQAKRLPSEDKLHFLTALCYQGLDKTAEAISEFNKSLELRASSPEVSFFYALSALKQNDPKTAGQLVQDALFFFTPSSAIPQAEFFYYQGWIYKLNGANSDATSALTKALQLNPALGAAQGLVAAMQLESGNRSQAIGLYREALGRSPDDKALKTGLSESLVFRADRNLHKADILQARKLSSGLMKEKELPKIYRARVCKVLVRSQLLSDEAKAARKTLRVCLKESPSDPELAALAEQISVLLQ